MEYSLCVEKEIEKTIKAIIEDLLFSKKISLDETYNGLLSGKMGVALFYGDYYKIYKYEKCLPFIQNFVTETLNDINDNKISLLSLSNGIAGILLSFFYLQQIDLLDVETSDLVVFDELLFENMIKQFRANKIDYLRGALGILSYFVYTLHYKPNNITYINQALIELNKTKQMYNNAYYWNNELYTSYDNSGINLSLSHGQASIIAVLINIINNCSDYGVNKTILYDLLNQTLRLYENIIDEITIKQNSFSHPDWLKNNKLIMSSRLAWCYGDLGISYTIMRAALLVGNIALYNKHLEILLNSTTIQEINSGVMDAGFCHGASGISFLYDSCYNITNDSKFYEASFKWTKSTIDMATFNDGIGGFKSNIAGNLQNCKGLLDGAAGIGLSLLSYLHKQEVSLAKILLLS